MILDDYTMIIIVLFRCPLYSPLLSHSYHIIIRLLFYYGIIIGLLLDEHLKKNIYNNPYDFADPTTFDG